jgi:hypothetical protein
VRDNAEHAEKLSARHHDLTAAGAALVIASEPVAGVPAPSVVIADSWGEIVHVVRAEVFAAAKPNPGELLEWVSFVRMQCPECPP